MCKQLISVFHLPHPLACWELIQLFFSPPYSSCKGHGNPEFKGAQSFLIHCVISQRKDWAGAQVGSAEHRLVKDADPQK